MAIDADNLPREGFNTQHFIDNMTERVGSNNIIDVIMSNPLRIARQVGARPPDFHPSHSELNMFKPKIVGNPNVPQQPMQEAVESNVPPKIEDMPDTPKGLHTPKAKMMPGSETEPGKPISDKDAAAFNKIVNEMNMKRGFSMQQTAGNSWNGIPSPFGNPRTGYSPQQSEVASKPVFFKDGLGNEYKTVGDKLYVLGWQDANVKVRLINETTGKEVPTSGRKFQIYGWHLVQKMNESESTEADDITVIENEIKTEEPVKKDIQPKVENHTPLPIPSAPMIAQGHVADVKQKTEEPVIKQDTTTENNVDDDKKAVSENQETAKTIEKVDTETKAKSEVNVKKLGRRRLI